MDCIFPLSHHTLHSQEIRSDLRNTQRDMAARVEIIGCLIVVAVLLQGAAADTYHVGGNISWSVPTGGESAYTAWASGEDFELGDTIGKHWISVGPL